MSCLITQLDRHSVSHHIDSDTKTATQFIELNCLCATSHIVAAAAASGCHHKHWVRMTRSISCQRQTVFLFISGQWRHGCPAHCTADHLMTRTRSLENTTMHAHTHTHTRMQSHSIVTSGSHTLGRVLSYNYAKKTTHQFRLLQTLLTTLVGDRKMLYSVQNISPPYPVTQIITLD